MSNIQIRGISPHNHEAHYNQKQLQEELTNYETNLGYFGSTKHKEDLDNQVLSLSRHKQNSPFFTEQNVHDTCSGVLAEIAERRFVNKDAMKIILSEDPTEEPCGKTVSEKFKVSVLNAIAKMNPIQETVGRTELINEFRNQNILPLNKFQHMLVERTRESLSEQNMRLYAEQFPAEFRSRTIEVSKLKKDLINAKEILRDSKTKPGQESKFANPEARKEAREQLVNDAKEATKDIIGAELLDKRPFLFCQELELYKDLSIDTLKKIASQTIDPYNDNDTLQDVKAEAHQYRAYQRKLNQYLTTINSINKKTVTADHFIREHAVANNFRHVVNEDDIGFMILQKNLGKEVVPKTIEPVSSHKQKRFRHNDQAGRSVLQPSRRGHYQKSRTV